MYLQPQILKSNHLKNQPTKLMLAEDIVLLQFSALLKCQLVLRTWTVCIRRHQIRLAFLIYTRSREKTENPPVWLSEAAAGHSARELRGYACGFCSA